MRWLLLLALVVAAACILSPRNIEGFACAEDVECLIEQGYRCVGEVCVFDPLPPDAGPGEAPEDGGVVDDGEGPPP